MHAGIYARISQDQLGDELGVGRQTADCQAEAARRGWPVDEVYIDNDVSATRSKRRPAYERMLADVRAGHITAIVVWDVDRLTRTPRELEDIIDLADQHGLALANVGGEIDLSTPQGRMTARIKGTVARHETEQMSRRLKRRFQEKAERGEPHGYSPYGYRRVDGRDVPEPDEATVILECARRVLDGESLRAVATDLNARGVHGPKAPLWNTTILRQILLRGSNAGLRQYQGKIIGSSTTEPVLDRATFDRLTALLTDPSRKTNQSGPGFKYLLSGIAICGRCGRCPEHLGDYDPPACNLCDSAVAAAGRMKRQVGRSAGSLADGTPKRQPPSYACTHCFKVRRKQEPVDDLVVDVLLARLSQPDALPLLSSGDPESVREAQRTITAIDAKLDVAADQFASDQITGAQLTRISARLRAERDAAERRLRAYQPNSRLLDLTAGDVRERWDAMPLDAQREVVDALMTVTINPSGIGTRFDPRSITIRWRQHAPLQPEMVPA
ncbi:recombinase family protein [Microbacterium maritypicum]|uniref:Recombinase family protein n=1 Tax=Microbacterium maritypicum TaxID=33918 RepID=A0AAD3X232_MICMQ|nr:recombinase family protein [Microbacterium liquefaciens]KAB1883957.1 recombinase family protein [Microbacterium liquefaciens]